jgi:hypothetical protein
VVTHSRKAEHVFDATNNPFTFKHDQELDQELISPTLSELGSEGEEGDIFEHVDDLEPSR